MPSLLRDFSAPVKMTVEGQSDDDLVFLFANDSDPFNRWDAGQRLAMKLVHSLYHAAAKANADPASEAAVAAACGAAGGVSDALVNAFRSVLTAGDLDGSFKVGVFGGGAYVCVCVCVCGVCAAGCGGGGGQRRAFGVCASRRRCEAGGFTTASNPQLTFAPTPPPPTINNTTTTNHINNNQSHHNNNHITTINTINPGDGRDAAVGRRDRRRRQRGRPRARAPGEKRG